MKKILFVLMMLLFVCPFTLGAQKIEKRRHNPASKTIELPPDWEVTVTYPYESMNYNYSYESKNYILFWTSCNETPSESLTATIEYRYIGKEKVPSTILTHAEVQNSNSHYLSGSLKAETGSLFNLAMTHTGIISGGGCLAQQQTFPLSMQSSGPYDKKTSSNIGIKGSVEGTIIKGDASCGSVTETKVYGTNNSLVFPNQEWVVGPTCYSLGSESGGAASVSYAFGTTMSVTHKHEIASSHVRGESTLVSVSYQPSKQ